MHILFFAEEFPASQKTAGGLRVSVRQQAEGLAARGRVTVVTMLPILPPLGRYRGSQPLAEAAAQPATDSLPANLRLRTYRYLHLPILWPFTEPLQMLLLGLWAVLRHARDADLFHAHLAYAPGVVATLLGKLLRRPSVVTIYGSDIHQQAVGGHRLRRGWIRWVLCHATRLIAVSRSLVATLDELGCGTEHCRYVPSGVDLARFAPAADRGTLRQELGLPATARVILAINLFVPIKGHQYLVEAFRHLGSSHPDCRLVMTSDGPLRQQIEAQVAAAGLGERVQFAGFLDYDDIPRWVAAADLLVLPSLNEGMPLSILEGFACGTPLVGSRVGGIPELVSDERYGILVPPADAAALATALAAALDRDWDTAALSARAREFAWPAVVERIAAIYREVVRDDG